LSQAAAAAAADTQQESQSDAADQEFLQESFTPSLHSGFTATSSDNVVQIRRDAMGKILIPLTVSQDKVNFK
jgi:hypothetical protein